MLRHYYSLYIDRKKGINIVDPAYYQAKMASKLAAQWRDVGIELDLQTNELDAISQTNHANSRCKEMLGRWLQKDEAGATWDKLYKVMCTLERNNYAEKMKKSVKELYKL